MKSDTMTAGEKQAKVLEFVKSAEFQKCPNEQKIEFSGHSRSSVAGLFLCVQGGGFLVTLSADGFLCKIP